MYRKGWILCSSSQVRQAVSGPSMFPQWPLSGKAKPVLTACLLLHMLINPTGLEHARCRPAAITLTGQLAASQGSAAEPPPAACPTA